MNKFSNLWVVSALFSCVVCATAHAQSTLFVDDDANAGGDGLAWTTAFDNLQSALSAAAGSSGTVTEIRVAQGVYRPSSPAGRTATFQLLNGVSIEGGYAGVGAIDPNFRDPANQASILSGDLNGDDTLLPAGGPPPSSWSDNSFHVVTGNETDSTASLDGFVITAGNADAGSNPDRLGGGLINTRLSGPIPTSGPSISNCIFLRNFAKFGGGLYNDNGAVITVRDCEFIGNVGESQGGGVHANNTNIAATFINSVFLGNVSRNGGGMYIRTRGELINCLFSGNEAVDTVPPSTSLSVGGGGGLFSIAVTTQLTLTNCTFSGNLAKRGGGFHASFSGSVGSSPRLNNCILWGNSASDSGDQFIRFGSSFPRFNHCDVQGSGGSGVGWDTGLGFDDGGNIDADPLFLDSDGADNIVGTIDDNLRLSFGSPGVDVGSTALVPAGVTTDMEGNPRVFNAVVDMGAFEFGDSDNDGVPDLTDNCPTTPNPLQEDADGDDLGDACDACSNDADNDIDGDGVCGDVDNCPNVSNPLQENTDGDSLGDICDPDDDNDGLSDVDEATAGTNPLDPDSDEDGLSDGDEVALAAGSGCPDPLDPDSDGDGESDGDEVTAATDPCNAAPIADAAVEQLTNIGATALVRLDGSGTADADDPVATLNFEWIVNTTTVCDGLQAACGTIEVGLPFGVHDVTLKVTDPAGGTSETSTTITIDPARLSVFEIDRAQVRFSSSRITLIGDIGLPFGVNFSEVAPTATTTLHLAGIDVLYDGTVAFTTHGSGNRRWRFDGSGPIRSFDIDWRGARFNFREARFPIRIKSQMISSSETVLTVNFRRRRIDGPFTINFDGQATVNVDENGEVTTDLPVEIERPRRRFTVTLPFPLTESSEITIGGAVSRTIPAVDHLRASVGRYRLQVNFDGNDFPDGVGTLPRTLDLSVAIGNEGYPGETMLDESDLRVRGNSWSKSSDDDDDDDDDD